MGGIGHAFLEISDMATTLGSTSSSCRHHRSNRKQYRKYSASEYQCYDKRSSYWSCLYAFQSFRSFSVSNKLPMNVARFSSRVLHASRIAHGISCVPSTIVLYNASLLKFNVDFGYRIQVTFTSLPYICLVLAVIAPNSSSQNFLLCLLLQL